MPPPVGLPLRLQCGRVLAVFLCLLCCAARISFKEETKSQAAFAFAKCSLILLVFKFKLFKGRHRVYNTTVSGLSVDMPGVVFFGVENASVAK